MNHLDSTFQVFLFLRNWKLGYEHVKKNCLCNYLIQGPSVKGCERLIKVEFINPAQCIPNKLGTLIINYDRFYTLLASVRDLIKFVY
jgi:hypothetical protein